MTRFEHVGQSAERGGGPGFGRRACRALGACVLIVACAAALLAAAAVPAWSRSFPDVPGSHPYAAAIDQISGRGIMTGYADGDFGPADPVTRQQFAKMIVRALGLAVTERDVSPFVDVAPSSGPDPLYPDHYVAVAAAHGITNGVSATHFGPWRAINRAQLISMVVRGVEAECPGRLAAPAAGYAATWRPTFSPQHGQNARTAQFNGLLSGLPLSTLDPWDPMPRAEAAQVLSNLLAALAAAPGAPLGPVVAFQPSHQDDTGAADWHEYRICGDIAQRTIALLEGSPVGTVLAWETGMGLTGSNNDGSNAKAFDAEIRRANDAGADYFISIHNDGGAPSGVLGMYFTGDTRSAELAETLARSLSRETGLPYRGIRGRPLYSLDAGRNHAPVRVLLEIGDNVRDRAFLEDPAGRVRIAAALAAEMSLLPVDPH
ncbi:MAG: S-layer homology domain-containing protein [Thermoleophilia bacterium]